MQTKKIFMGIATIAASAAIGIYGLWALYPLLITSGSHDAIPGDLGDARLLNIIMEHSFQYFFSDRSMDFWSPFWNFFPSRNALAMSDVMATASLLYIPWRLLDFDYHSSLQLWHLSTSLANYVSFIFFLRCVGVRLAPASVGAFLFAFSLTRGGFLNHPQLLAQYWTPLALGFLIKWLRENELRGQIKFAVVTVIMISCQFWSAFYFGWFLAFGMMTLAGILIFRFRGSLLRATLQRRASILVAGVTFLILTGPLAMRHMMAAKDIGMRSTSDVLNGLPILSDYLMPQTDTTFYQALFQWAKPAHENYSEFGMFLGTIPILLLAMLLISEMRRNRASKLQWQDNFPAYAASLAAVLFLCIFLMITKWNHSDTLWRALVHVIPAAKAIRSMGRIVLFLLVPSGLIVAVYLDRLSQMKSRWAKIAAIMIGLSVIAEQHSDNRYAFSKSESMAEIQGVVKKIPPQCDVFYVNTRYDNFWRTAINAMWASIITGKATLNGYSGGTPPGYQAMKLDQPGHATINDANQWLTGFGNPPLAAECFLQ